MGAWLHKVSLTADTITVPSLFPKANKKIIYYLSFNLNREEGSGPSPFLRQGVPEKVQREHAELSFISSKNI